MKLSEMSRKIRIMEICGTHTLSILRSGIKELLPSNIEIISGPGCPVCVTNQAYIDACIKLSKVENIIITTFGDMINTPSSKGSLMIERAKGSNIRVVYSPIEAVNIAKENPKYEVIFLGIGFETTAPTIGIAIEKAYIEGVKNFSVFSALKTMPEAIKRLLSYKEVKVDGIICPGHVSTIIGEHDFSFISSELKIPSVIAGFEDRDVIFAIYLLIDMITNNQHSIKNIYRRFVKYQGNSKAKELIERVFQCTDSDWRGIGTIENTGLKIRNKYINFDAKEKFNIKMEESPLVEGCICGDILRGQKVPKDCISFGKKCTPYSPIGVCMVSREGACGIQYKYLNK